MPATPLVPASSSDVGDGIGDAPAIPSPVVAIPGGASSVLSFSAPCDEHEDAVRKRRVRSKRASDSAFKARRSSRLASKEAPLFTDMLTKAKTIKASRFTSGKGSPRLRKAVAALRLDEAVPDAISLPLLKDLAVPCGVDPAALDAVASVTGSAP
jgi:hypothetical protein